MDDYGVADTNDPEVRILWERHGRTVTLVLAKVPDLKPAEDGD